MSATIKEDYEFGKIVIDKSSSEFKLELSIKKDVLPKDSSHNFDLQLQLPRWKQFLFSHNLQQNEETGAFKGWCQNVINLVGRVKEKYAKAKEEKKEAIQTLTQQEKKNLNTGPAKYELYEEYSKFKTIVMTPTDIWRELFCMF